MRVRWSSPALDDLTKIVDRLNTENPVAAGRLVRRLDGVMRRIALFPEAAPEVEQRPGVRRIPLVRYPFIVFYKCAANEAIILRIRHAAMERPWEDVG
jgi:toxin ParE1/3/4